MEHVELPLFHAENIPERPNRSEEKMHPTPEQLLVREAVKYLTPKQRKVWALYNYDKLTQEEIAVKLKIRQQTVNEYVQAIEKKITKWVISNMGAYRLLKGEIEP